MSTGPLWNSYGKSDAGMVVGKDGNGVKLNRDFSEAVLAFWEDTSVGASKYVRGVHAVAL